MTTQSKLDALVKQGYKVTIRYGKMWSINGGPFDGYRVNVTDQIKNGWNGEADTLVKAINIVYKKFEDFPPRVKF